MVVPDEDGNDAAMEMLKAGTADAMFVYSNQAKNYQACQDPPTWDCDLWKGFGTDYAYVQTGQFGYTLNGTTLVIGKKGSGKAAMVNACLTEYMETKAYFDVCEKHKLTSSCYQNSYFSGDAATAIPTENKPTDEQTGDCCDGYCPCDAKAATCESAGVTTSGAEKQAAPLLAASVVAALWTMRV